MFSQAPKKKYGLQLRGPQATSASKKPLPPPKKPSIFNDNDDEDSVEQAIARQAAKKRALKEVEQQHKAALEEDSSVFAYDEVYDDMKAESVPFLRAKPEQQNKPKYIAKLIDKAKARQQEQEIVYERKLLKERQLEDHLYSDKDKFVTAAYKQKLAEQAKWLEEEKLRELREKAEEVTNKSDLSDFYRNLLTKNVAFGAFKHKGDTEVPQEPAEQKNLNETEGEHRLIYPCKTTEPEAAQVSDKGKQENEGKRESEGKQVQPGAGTPPMKREDDAVKESLESKEMVGSERQQPAERKSSEDAIMAAKERFLARKKMRAM